MPAEVDTLAVYDVEFGLRVADIEHSLHFWRDIVGFEPYAEIFVPGGVHVYGLRFGRQMLKLMVVDDTPSDEQRPGGDYGGPATDRGAPFTTHYLTIHVLNGQEMEATCRAAGIEIIAAYSPMSGAREGDPSCHYVLVKDPDGNTIEFSEGSPWVYPTTEFKNLGRGLLDGVRPV